MSTEHGQVIDRHLKSDLREFERVRWYENLEWVVEYKAEATLHAAATGTHRHGPADR